MPSPFDFVRPKVENHLQAQTFVAPYWPPDHPRRLQPVRSAIELPGRTRRARMQTARSYRVPGSACRSTFGRSLLRRACSASPVCSRAYLFAKPRSRTRQLGHPRQRADGAPLGLLGVPLLSQRFPPGYSGARGANGFGSGSRFLLGGRRFVRFRRCFLHFSLGARHRRQHLRGRRQAMLRRLHSHRPGALHGWCCFVGHSAQRATVIFVRRPRSQGICLEIGQFVAAPNSRSGLMNVRSPDYIDRPRLYG